MSQGFDPDRQPQFLGHPVGLFVLFFTEMWERMSYYGMRALLVLYMVDHLLLRPDVGEAVLGFATLRGILESAYGPLENQALASQIYGVYTAFVYLTPFFGGLLADRVLGQRRSVLIGGSIMALGHFLMAFENLFLLALITLIIGNGAFKPNISTQVGALYKEGDSRRDGAYTIFYLGINLGAFLSPLVCGTLGQTMGWHYGFGAAGVGMILGLIVYVFGQKYLAPDSLALREASAAPAEPMTSNEWRRVGALIVLCGLNVVFWGVYEQQGNTMQLWADDRTWWPTIGSFTIPTTWYQSFNPAMIFLFAPLLDRLWAWQSGRGNEPSSVTKMAIGCGLLGSAYLIMIGAVSVVPEDQKANLGWLVATTFVLTIGELYLSPIGLSLVSKVAPPRIVSMMMGMWFLSSFAGNYLSGFLGMYWERMPKEAFFMMLSALALTTGLVMFAINKPLRRATESAN